MATRRQIKEAFHDHLTNAANGHVDVGNVGLEQPESNEELPALVYRGDYRKVPMNEGSAAPAYDEYDNNDNATAEVFKKVREASFGVLVVGEDESTREDAYEAVRSYFEKFEEDPWDPSTIQSDINKVRVIDSTAQDDDDRIPIARTDRLLIRLQFTLEHKHSVEHLDQVNTTLDADDDGTTDESYTFSG